MVKVKICGITNVDDALAAVEAGADALGFNFYRPSPRFISPGLAREIIRQLPASVTSVGVFANEADANAVARIAGEAGVFTVQLHGDESPEYCRTLEGLSVIKVLRVKDDLQQRVAELFAQELRIVGIDGIDYLVCLFNEVLLQRLRRLFAVPRASVGSPQTGHYPGERLQPRAALLRRQRGNENGCKVVDFLTVQLIKRNP